MAILGRWSAGTTTLVPGTTWAAPASLFTTQDRNDSGTYTWTAATSTLTLPSTIVADGYLIRARVEVTDTSNGRAAVNGKIIQASGTGNIVTTQVGGYLRDSSEDTAWVQTVAVVDNPSASATFQFQWLRGTDAPAGGTINSHIEVIPLYYSNIGMYTGTTVDSTSAYSAQTLSTTVVESDTAAIQRATGGTDLNTITLKGDNKRYLIIGNTYNNGTAGARTMRMHGLVKNGVFDESSAGYTYHRNAANNEQGGLTWDLHELGTSDETLELHKGIAIGALANEPSAESAQSFTEQYSALIVIELNDDAEVIRGHDSGIAWGSATGVQDISPEANTEIHAIETTDFNDAASFTRVDNATINVEQDMDAFVGAGVTSARTTNTSTQRYTAQSYITVNNTPDAATKHGHYCRGDQSSTGTRGGASQAGGAIALSSGDDLSVTMGNITGGESSNTGVVQTQGASIWAINLDTLEAKGAGEDTLTADDLQSTSSVTQPAAGQSHVLTADDLNSASSVTQPATGQAHVLAADDLSSTTSVTTPSLGQAHNALANELNSASEVSSPAVASIAGTDTLTADDLQSTSEVSTPDVGQEHSLLADDLNSATNVSQPALAETLLRLVPDADTSIGSWTTHTGSTSNLYQQIDELTANDSDYIQSEPAPSASKAKFSLSNEAVSASDTQRVRYRYCKDASDGVTLDLTVRLIEGASTVIASWTHLNISTTLTAADQTLTGPQKAAIVDYDDLFIEFEASI